MDLPERKPTRLKNFDYSQNGYYFLTICTHNRKNILSNMIVVGWLKYNTTTQINKKNNTSGNKIFQRSFHDHIIRGENDYLKSGII